MQTNRVDVIVEEENNVADVPQENNDVEGAPQIVNTEDSGASIEAPQNENAEQVTDNSDGMKNPLLKLNNTEREGVPENNASIEAPQNENAEQVTDNSDGMNNPLLKLNNTEREGVPENNEAFSQTLQNDYCYQGSYHTPRKNLHSLQYAWTLWSKVNNTPTIISSIEFEEQFWYIYQTIDKASIRPINTEYCLFKLDHTPNFNSAENMQGGRLVFCLTQFMPTQILDAIWLQLQLLVLHEGSVDAFEICGVVMRKTANFTEFSLWISNTFNSNRVIYIGFQFASILPLKSYVIHYRTNSDAVNGIHIDYYKLLCVNGFGPRLTI